MKVFVVGVGMTNFEKPGRRDDFDYPDMALEATNAALTDANLAYTDVERAFVGYCYGESCCGQKSLYQLGMTGIPIVNVNNNCATGSSALYLGHEMLAGNRSDCVLALGFEKMQRGSLGALWQDRANPIENHMAVMVEKYGYESGPPTAQLFGNAGREHMSKYGTKPEHFAKIAEKNHCHSVNNPRSQFKDLYSLQQVQHSKYIHDPLTKLQCCPTSDGAAAAVLVSERFLALRPHLKRSAVELMGISLTTDLASTFEGSAMRLVGYDMTRLAAQQVYSQANITPDQLDVIELHDCFSANELITYEALGLCPEGGSGAFIDRGDNTYGGKYVINPSGGLISKGHPLGATGIAQCVELCLQLRGLAGKRQVANARIGLQHNLGLGGACVVAAYKKPNSVEFDRKSSLPKLLGGNPTAVKASDFKCAAVFDAIAEQITDPKNADVVKKTNASYKFKVTGKAGQGVWLVNAKVGSSPFVRFMDDGKADCVLTAKDDDLFDIMSGKLDSMKAFLGGKLKLSGNPTLATKLNQFQGKVKEALKNQKKSNALDADSEKDFSSKSQNSSSFASDKIFDDIKQKLTLDPGLAKKVGAAFRFVIRDSVSQTGKSWFVNTKSNPPLVSSDDDYSKADCTIEVTDDDFVKIIEGKLNPQTAFFNKQLKVTGNVMLATKLTQFQQKNVSKL